MDHPNSKIVYLKRTKPFVHESMHSEIMQEQLSYTKRSIGDYYASGSSDRPGTGLTVNEEKILLPALLGIEVNGEFYEKLKKYYTEINTQVPHGQVGLELEIGLELDNSKPITFSQKTSQGVDIFNMPLNLKQYLIYRHALGCSLTAPSPEAAEGAPADYYWFYVEDPKLVLQSKMGDVEIRDKAMTDYAQMKSDPKKVKMLVSVMRSYIKKRPGRPPVNVNNLGQDELVLTLRELATDRPEKFHELANDQDLKKRYFVDELLSVGLVQRVGNSIIDKETNQNMGDTVKEVVMFLWNPKEATRLNRFKLEYDQKTSNKVLAE